MTDLMTKSTDPDPITKAINSLKDDPGAIFEPALLILLRAIRQDDPPRWARYRQSIKSTGLVSMVDLDKHTSSPAKKEISGEDLFPKVKLWPERVDGTSLLNDIKTTLSRYVVANKETLHAAALWIIFTWFIDVVHIAPIANITAPEKRCGKTILLSVFSKLVRRPLQTANIAPAALFRSIEMWALTLLIDEVDTFLATHEDARGILNAGFTRDSAFVLRCVGDDHTPTPFNVWGAKALCGIGNLADTLADRSIPLRLRRKLPGESVEPLRHSAPEMWGELRSRIARFASDNAESIAKARPAPIDGLNDRANDCWEPLLAIAESAGGRWPKRARMAATVLHGLETEPLSIGVELLADVRAVFNAKGVTRMSSADLLNALIADDESPWATWNRATSMTARQLAAKLKGFGAKPKDIRLGRVQKGYERADFTDAFARYLPPDEAPPCATPRQPNNGAASSAPRSATPNPSVADGKLLKLATGVGCSVVADSVPACMEVDNPAAWDANDEEVI